MKRIWVSAAGTGNAFATVKAVKKYHPDSFLLTTDTNPSYLTTASLWADIHVISPFVTDESYEDFIINTIKKNNIDTYIPFIDKEISIAATLYENLKIPREISLQVKNSEAGEICENKLSSYQFLQKLNICSPKTASAETPFPANEYILKPLRGFGSQIKKITNAELEKVSEKSKYIVQEICEPPEVTIDVIRSKSYNSFHYICRERLQTKSGVCVKARLFQEEELGEIANIIAKNLNLVAFCFQVMRLKDNWAVTDINPRLGAGTALSLPVGSDFFGAMLSVLWDQDPSPFLKPLDKICYVTRQYEEYLMQY